MRYNLTIDLGHESFEDNKRFGLANVLRDIASQVSVNLEDDLAVLNDDLQEVGRHHVTYGPVMFLVVEPAGDTLSVEHHDRESILRHIGPSLRDWLDYTVQNYRVGAVNSQSPDRLVVCIG